MLLRAIRDKQAVILFTDEFRSPLHVADAAKGLVDILLDEDAVGTRHLGGYERVSRFDLVQVHNLLAWERHLQTLFAMKANGALRYVGITTSHKRRHREIEHVMATQPIDFVQVTYNVLDREVEARILPLARERGIAVIANRPFRRGHLIRQIEHHSLPHWVAETGASTWAKFILKFIVSHPAVTCAIPATTRVDHVRENMTAAMGILPDATLRRRMAAYVAQL